MSRLSCSSRRAKAAAVCCRWASSSSARLGRRSMGLFTVVPDAFEQHVDFLHHGHGALHMVGQIFEVFPLELLRLDITPVVLGFLPAQGQILEGLDEIGA